MALTEQEREKRRHFVGSSDLPALCGVHPQGVNAADIFYRKKGLVEESDATIDMKRGVALEPYILDLFSADMEVMLKRDLWLESDVDKDGLGFCANLDAAILEMEDYPVAPVEAKSSNDPKYLGFDTMPEHIFVQVQWQLSICATVWARPVPLGWAPALFPDYGRFRFERYPVQRDDALIEELRYLAFEFLECLRRDVPPKNVTPRMQTLKRLRREPETVVSLGDDAADAWETFQTLSDKRKGAERDEEDAKAAVLAYLGTNEGGRFLDGSMVTYLSQRGAPRVDHELLKSRDPQLYEAVVTQNHFRVLRHKKAPKVKRRGI